MIGLKLLGVISGLKRNKYAKFHHIRTGVLFPVLSFQIVLSIQFCAGRQSLLYFNQWNLTCFEVFESKFTCRRIQNFVFLFLSYSYCGTIGKVMRITLEFFILNECFYYVLQPFQFHIMGFVSLELKGISYIVFLLYHFLFQNVVEVERPVARYRRSYPPTQIFFFSWVLYLYAPLTNSPN